MAKETVRFTVNLNKELADAVDGYAENMCINRTAAVSVLLSQAVNSNKVMSTLEDLLSVAKSEKQATTN